MSTLFLAARTLSPTLTTRRTGSLLLRAVMSTKQYEHILTSRPRDGVALITLNRPKALNALSTPLFTELNDAVAAFDQDEDIRALVLTGSDRAFAGALRAGPNCVQAHRGWDTQRARTSRR